MEYENDFVNEDLVEIEIEGKIFKYKPTTAGDELSWVDECMYVDNDGKPKQDTSKVQECKIRNLVEVPYSKELIGKIVGVEREWKNLSNEQKGLLFKKLKPRTFDKIIIAMNKVDLGSEVKKK